MVKVNLFDFMNILNMEDVEHKYGWRFRINDLVVFFMDNQDNLIPNGQINQFSMNIYFPPTFYDLDRNKEPQMFATSFPWDCESQYSRSGKTRRGCAIVDRAKEIRSTSPNGTFVFRLQNEEQYLNLTQLHYLEISINGTMFNFP